MASKAKAKNTFNEPEPVVTQPANLPTGYKAKKQVTLPSLSMKEGQTFALRFDTAMRVSEVMDKKTEGKKPRDPATIANVTDVATGEQYIFIVPSVVKSNLERDYKDESYVGCVFQITHKGKRKESQRYFDFAITELEPA